ncbi:toxin-antitoxin system TumE family protein [Fibrella aquatica]|jgi:Family of unknown function (DUF6516)|uniref:toxin-antitoxin system TumE family protein n=1 Tax=Fibrella aquatica TaxID=3242487 RepID=UPI0035221937
MTHNLYPFSHIILASTALDPIERPDLTQVRGRITFVDQSVLHIRENYVILLDRIDYAYQWQTADHQLIHRWDNAHPVSLPTSPHHQHQGSEENVVASEPMTLQKVLTFISTQLTSS